MKPTAVLSCLALVPVVTVSAPARAGETRTISERFDLAAGQDVRMDFPVGSLRVQGVEGSTVEVEIRLTCERESRRCAEAIAEVELAARPSPGRLALDIAREPKWLWDDLEMRAVVRHPADRPLTVDMGVGELEIEGVRADLRLDLGVGEVEVTAPAAGVRSARLDAGVGEAALRLPEGWVDERRSFLVGGEIHWDEGEGDSDLWVDVGVGEVSVRLED